MIAVNYGVMSHRHVVADMGLRRVLRAVEQGVDHHAVLDVRPIADGDRVHIAA